MPVLLVERADGVATVTLNRPEALNALNGELREALAKTFAELSGDEEVRVAILTGAGRAFTAGIDLKEMGSARPSDAGAADYGMLDAIAGFPGPLIGAVNGHAITGGFELALACDLLIASENAVFADTHARVGLVPGWGLSQRLPRIIGIGRAKELSFTGNFLSAEQAERWGLVNRVVPAEELLPTCRALARDMLSCEPTTLVRYKRAIDRGYALGFGEAMELERTLSREHLAGVTSDAVASRRAEIQARGRRQQG